MTPLDMLEELHKEFGEGEVIYGDYDFQSGITFTLVALNCRQTRIFTRQELLNATGDIFAPAFDKMFAMIKKEINLRGA